MDAYASLRFNPDKYEVQSCSMDGLTVTYRAYMDLPYCLHPVDPVQRIHLYVPEAYYAGRVINGYDLKHAPIFFYNTVSGYMQGDPGEPGKDFFTMRNGFFEALIHGYVVAAPGSRGRNSKIITDMTGQGTSESSEIFDGKAPAMIVDLKAAIRWLRLNKDLIPGDTDHILTNGTSAGGAMSALLAASGNHPDYQPYLDEIGAAPTSDEIFAACCYCPIHNLDHADGAYEWMFDGETVVSDLIYHFDFEHQPLTLLSMEYDEKPMDEGQLEVSRQLKKQFIAYVNGLGLTDDDGRPLTLDEHGNGSFKEQVKRYVLSSARAEAASGRYRSEYAHLTGLLPQDTLVWEQDCFKFKEGEIADLDWMAFVKSIRRNKFAPAFDDLGLKSCENDAFGTKDTPARHFTAFSQENSTVAADRAPDEIVRMMNPLNYIGAADTAKHWWIRHSVHDCATALAIPVILATTLKNKEFNVNFELPWGLPHCGDYDLNVFFSWADALCKA